MLQYNPSISGSLSVTGSLIVTNGVIGTVSGVDVQIFSSSINQVITGIQAATGSQEGRLTSIESFTSSVSTTNTFTSSTSARLNSIETISASNISRIGSLETISASNVARISSLESTSASVDTLNTAQNARLNSLENKTGSLATTGSNTFIGTQVFTGSVYITQNLVVQGSSSLQNITASAVSIGTNTILLNTDNPAIRYAGISAIDSGSSAGKSGSLYFDSTDNEWIFVHAGNTAVTSSTMITGPETYDSIGNETRLTTNRLTKATQGFHIIDSNISDDGTTIKLLLNTEVTGSLKVTSTSTFNGNVSASVGLTIGSINSGNDAILKLATNASASPRSITYRAATAAISIDDTSGNALMTVLNGGKIGVGVTNPYGTFEISSSAQSYSTAPAITFTDSSGDASSNRWIVGNIATTYGTFNIASAPTPSSTIWTPRLSILSDGKVGIGTAAPARPLSIYNGSVGLYNSSTGQTSTDGVTFELNGTAGYLWNYENDSLIFGTNNSERVRITSGGSVGIGTTDPGYRFQVKLASSAWASNFENSAGTESVGVYLAHGDGYGIAIDSSENDSKYIFKAMAGTGAGGGRGSVPVIFAQHNGKVGIGNDAPSVALQVGSGSVASIPSWMKVMTTDATQSGIGAVYNNKATYIYNNGSTLKLDAYDYSNGVGLDVQIGGNGGKILLANGNVGIGTTNPASKLEVVGGVTINGTASDTIQNSGSPYLYFVGGGSSYTTIQQGSSKMRWWQFNGSSWIKTWDIDYNGNATLTGTFTENSSLRYKENIETIKYGLDKVLQMRGVTYNKKDNGVKELGVIAEEIYEILPDIVLKNEEGEVDSVSYGRISAVLIEAIKEQQKQIEELKSLIK